MSIWKRNRLRELRRGRKLTQHVLARRIGVSQGTYSMWETGFNEPVPDQKARLAKALKCEPADLVPTPESPRGPVNEAEAIS